jgi:hypothetical protein
LAHDIWVYRFWYVQILVDLLPEIMPRFLRRAYPTRVVIAKPRLVEGVAIQSNEQSTSTITAQELGRPRPIRYKYKVLWSSPLYSLA